MTTYDDAVDEAAAEEESVPVEVESVDEEAAPVVDPVVEAAVVDVGAAVEPPVMENWPE